MVFGKRRDHHDSYDESYARRPVREKSESPSVMIHLAILAVLGISAIGIVWGAAGRTMAEKTLKELVAPVGLVWILLGMGVWFSFVWRRAGSAVLLLLVWGILTAGGNEFVASRLIQSLEQPWIEAEQVQMAAGPDAADDPAKTKPFDLVIVLGGGTTADPLLRPQLGFGGDRVMKAAQLYHAGQAQRICVTGEQTFRSVEGDPDPAEEARDLLKNIGVPEGAIVALRGKNTSGEMQFIRQWLDAQPDSATWRIGLVTSAWHMSRAMKLAENVGLHQLHAVPADWMSQPWAPGPSLVVPSASNLGNTARAIHEYLGRWIGR